MTMPLRQPLLVNLQQADGLPGRALARAQNFTVERLFGHKDASFDAASVAEMIILLPSVGAALGGDRVANLPGHAIAILPPGAYSLTMSEAGEIYVLATHRSDPAGCAPALNSAQYSSPDPRVTPVGASFARTAGQGDVRIHPIADIAIPPDNGRLRFLQSATMSLNWVEYDGVRDRKALSPHDHADLEQASLAIEGDFVHHLRTPWGRDADQWQDDQHLAAGPASVVIIPPQIIHTTEGSGAGRHVLVDVFAPPRADFIARNWVFNAREYAPPAGDAA